MSASKTISRESREPALLTRSYTSLFITVLSVGVIILCTSMCAWYISRVKNRFTTALLFSVSVFSMIVPFQMVMFTLSKLADMLKLNNPLGIVIVYLGFGAGLSVFMFCGFVKSIPLEIEEAAMIDGCTPLQTFFGIVMPIMKPTCITVAQSCRRCGSGTTICFRILYWI